ncbi:putative poly(ADP-ribose) polymerase, catalytic domain-containing protein [Rosa chinensis]|uniref:Putative poly(ADP-ribose) polymerase, catalytic domain-containing protein n=1 Tax=Rosa chinensis TaxID=74649 RepID=A0A2P6PK57_ROSCH|nr:putative poly(ADP-ribose) polymerase, catalytic domain-containing protein [Rosa chinensis]
MIWSIEFTKKKFFHGYGIGTPRESPGLMVLGVQLYADNYSFEADENGLRHMLLCKVILGKRELDNLMPPLTGNVFVAPKLVLFGPRHLICTCKLSFIQTGVNSFIWISSTQFFLFLFDSIRMNHSDLEFPHEVNSNLQGIWN